jgi:transaldolase
MSTLEAGLEEARAQLAHLTDVGVDLGLITQKLQSDGTAAFVKSLESLMVSISEKRKQ